MTNQLPRGWATSNLKDAVLSISYGFTAPATAEEVGPKLLRITDVQDGKVDWSNVPYCTCVDMKRFSLKSGDIVVARTGATTGKSFLIRELPQDCVFASYLIRLQTSQEAPADYLGWYMQTPAYWNMIARVTKGTAQPGANATILSNLKIPVAPLNEQRRMVAKIEALMARSGRAKEALDAIPALLHRYRQSVLAAAFRGDLTAGWRAHHLDVSDANTYLREIEAANEKLIRKRRGRSVHLPLNEDAQGVQFDAYNLPPLPEAWAWTTLSKLISLVNPLCYGVIQPGSDRNGGVPLIRVCDLAGGTVDVTDLRTIAPEIDAQYERSRVGAGDLLVTVVGTIGRIAIVPNEANGANIARAIARTCVNEMLPTLWVAEWLETPFMQDWLVRGAREVARKTLNLGVLAGAPVPLAPSAEVQEVLRFIQDAMRISGTFTAAIEAARSQFADLNQSILAKAFRGQLVPQDPNDEPAHLLLARIKAGRAASTPTRRTRLRKQNRPQLITS